MNWWRYFTQNGSSSFKIIDFGFSSLLEDEEAAGVASGSVRLGKSVTKQNSEQDNNKRDNSIHFGCCQFTPVGTGGRVVGGASFEDVDDTPAICVIKE